MVDVSRDLIGCLRTAVRSAFGHDVERPELTVQRSEFADYQTNLALLLASKLKRSPQEIARQLVSQLSAENILQSATVSGPGFINLTCRNSYLASQLDAMLIDPRLGVASNTENYTAIIDYSAPNLAKEMHVGHLRSTIIGDCLARTLEFLGCRVIRQNHLGDWGTPFGMLLEQMLDQEGRGEKDESINELSAFYRAARLKFDTDPAFAARARKRVVMLQEGDLWTKQLWERLIAITVRHLSALYERLDISLASKDIAPESMYNAQLGSIVDELNDKHLLQDSDGALCAYPAGFAGRDGKPFPLIVRKSDGGFGYAATDLAALKYRVVTLHAQRLLYVVGAPQTQHLAMVFAVGRAAGWLQEEPRLEHVAFGSVLGQDGKVLKTRAGEAISLNALLDEAEKRAAALVQEHSPSLVEETRVAVARALAVGSVKYADLANDLVKDYTFSWSRMLGLEGNTAPYVMYTHARAHSILRKALLEQSEQAPGRQNVLIQHEAEKRLALEILEFPSTVMLVAQSARPHHLCQKLFQIARAFNAFYDSCPVLTSATETRQSRLAFCLLTARVIACGLQLLGIRAPEHM